MFKRALNGVRIAKDLVTDKDFPWGAIPGMIPFAMQRISDAPHSYKLEVDHDYVARKEAELREHEKRIEEMFGRRTRTPRPDPSYKPPNLKVIHAFLVNKSIDGVAQREECRIAIDLDTKRISTFYTTDWLLGTEHRGSGEIGVMLFTLPFTIPMLPFLGIARAIYTHRERCAGMSRHDIALLKALDGQLDAETQSLLKEAMRNTWAHEIAMNRTVTFEEAKQLLRSCKLVVRTIPNEAAESNPALARMLAVSSYDWFDAEGEHVGWCHHYHNYPPVVRVLGTDFGAEEFEGRDINIHELFDCYREKTVEQKRPR